MKSSPTTESHVDYDRFVSELSQTLKKMCQAVLFSKQVPMPLFMYVSSLEHIVSINGGAAWVYALYNTGLHHSVGRCYQN